MFGTELDTAYYGNNNTVSNQHQLMHIETSNEQEQQTRPTIKSKPTITEQINYDTTNTHNAPTISFPSIPLSQTNDSIIKELQMELEKQKQLNKKDNSEPLYDRFVSKKKDVMKLICIALTVLLAISLHFVFQELITTYIQNNDFTSNKELLVRFMYPSSVLAVLWTIKVFNK